MLVDTRDILGSSLATRRLWEPHVTPLVHDLLTEGDVFVDVGAHIGYYTLIASRIVGPNGCVYALEPHPATRKLLKANVRRNDASNVRILAVAAGAERTEGVLSTPSAGDAARMSLAVRGIDDGEPVSVASLADIVSASDIARLSLIKIDVEGYEDRVLRGLEPVLGRGGARPTILVEVHAHLNSGVRKPVADFCRRTGMAPHLIGDDEGFDRRFTLPHAPMTRRVTPDWIVTSSVDHFELLLTPVRAAQ
jgi:FkbM family methyltransferase